MSTKKAAVASWWKESCVWELGAKQAAASKPESLNAGKATLHDGITRPAGWTKI